MEMTKHWVPFNMRFYTALQSVFPLEERDKYVLTLRVRDAEGRVLEERAFNNGEPVTGVSSLVLDFSDMFAPLMQKAVVGLTEVVFVADHPYVGEGCNYFVGPRGFTCFLNGPQQSINQRNPKSRYRGFSVHFVDQTVEGCGLVVMNVSTNPQYSRVAQMEYDVCDQSGHAVQSGSLDVPPFGTRWVAIDERLPKTQASVYTMFARSDGSAMISLIWTHLKGGGLGLDHTQPPPTQFMYGEDVSPGLRNRYKRLRHRLSRRIRYRFNRVDNRPLIKFRW